MKLILESSYSISNNVRTYCEYDDLILREIYTTIFLDICETLSDEEYYEREAKGDNMRVEIGQIHNTIFEIKDQFEESTLYTVADSNNADIEKIIPYFLYGKGKQNLKENYIFPDAIYYINKVIIKPEYRGDNYGLYALALLLESIAEGQIVACHPVPIDYDDNKDEHWRNFPIDLNDIEKTKTGYVIKDKLSPKKAKKIRILKKYWSKLGLNNYDEKENILWTTDWEMPKWIRKKLFPSMIEHDDESELNYDGILENKDSPSENEKILIMNKEQIVKDFNDFLECYKEYKIDYQWNNFDLLICFFYNIKGGTLNLIEKLEPNDKNELRKLVNKNGETIFDEEKFAILLLAKDFALNNDPHKRLNYRCTVEYQFDSILDSYPPLTATIDININAISNKYLQLPEEDDICQDYISYLYDLASQEIDNKYPFYNIDQYFGSSFLSHKLID